MTNHRYVSGAEEKVLRAFSAPSTFLDNLTRITGAQVGFYIRSRVVSK